jgi:hypothetical protein
MHSPPNVIPAQAGIQIETDAEPGSLDSRLRGNDGSDVSLFTHVWLHSSLRGKDETGVTRFPVSGMIVST